jgi:hypothetical protein
VLFARHRVHFVRQHSQRSGDFRPGLARVDDIVNKATLGGYCTGLGAVSSPLAMGKKRQSFLLSQSVAWKRRSASVAWRQGSWACIKSTPSFLAGLKPATSP